MLVYKLTDASGRTYGGTQWGEGIEHTAPGGGELCSSAYLHAYRDLLLAVLLDPIHGGFGADARAWESDADVEVEDGTKLGCTRLRIDRELPLPSLTTEQRVTCAILAAREVYHKPAWVRWSDRWLTGEDRSAAAARKAAAAAWAPPGSVSRAEAARAAAATAAEAAGRATDAAEEGPAASAAWTAAGSAAWTVRQSVVKAARTASQPLDLVAIVHQVVESAQSGGEQRCLSTS